MQDNEMKKEGKEKHFHNDSKWTENEETIRNARRSKQNVIRIIKKVMQHLLRDV